MQPLGDYDGLCQLGGMWTSGGNMSNHVAVAAALAARWPHVRAEGLRALPNKPGIVLARGVEHFSYLGAAQALGLGSDGTALDGTNESSHNRRRSSSHALTDPPGGIEPFMVVGVAGNCRTTGLDHLHELRSSLR